MIASDLDHLAVAAEHQSLVWPRYVGDLGGSWVAGGATVGFDSAQVRFANGMKLEALHPYAVERNDFLRRFLDRSGPGPHHMTFKVPDLGAALEDVERAGWQPVNVDMSDPGWKEAFLHPKQACGVVVQLAQSDGEWGSEPPADLPSPKGPQATFHRVTHAVADLDDGVRLFADLLGGTVTGEGGCPQHRFVDLAWPGPGRVRLLQPLGDGDVARWLGGAPGRVYDLAFVTPAASSVPNAASHGALWVVAPEDNLGVRLTLAAEPGPLAGCGPHR
ncbi:MAG TPA: VOC family protein [Acidimicrobiales bacterium]|nr:VOC family protein [Acidimicrobiales bacterium]